MSGVEVKVPGKILDGLESKDKAAVVVVGMLCIAVCFCVGCVLCYRVLDLLTTKGVIG